MIKRTSFFQNLQNNKDFICFNTILFLFIFNMINREFYIFGKIDLRYIALVIIYIHLLFNYKKLKRMLINANRFSKLVFSFYLLIMLSTILNYAFKYSSINTQLLFNLQVLYLYGFSIYIYILTFRDKFSFNKMYFFLMISLIVLTFSMAYSYFNSDLSLIWGKGYGLISNARITNLLGANFRLSGYAEDPNYASLSLVIGMISTLFYVKDYRKYIIILIFSFAYIFTASKTLIIALLFAISVYLYRQFFVNKKIELRYKAYIFLFVGILLISLAPLLIGVLKHFTNSTIFDMFGTSLGLRFKMWDSAVSLFIKSPVLGNGLGTARTAFSLVEGGWMVQTHNTYLQILSENGLIVFVIYIYIFCNMILGERKFTSVISSLMFIWALTFEMNYLSFFPFLLIVQTVDDFGCYNDTSTLYDVYFVNSLSGGGAEKAVSNLLDESTENVNILIKLDEKRSSIVFSDKITINVNLSNPISLWFSLIKIDCLIYSISKKNVSLSSAHLLKSHILCNLTCLGDSSVYVFHSTSKSFNINYFTLKVYKIIYNNKRIAVLSNSIGEDICNSLHIEPNYVGLFNNAIPFKQIDEVVSRNSSRVLHLKKPYILFCGRLETVKQPDFIFNMMIESELILEYDLVIVGDGSMKRKLEEISIEHNIVDRVHFEGFVDKPYDFMKNAQVTLLSSQYEASPLIITEVLYSGGKIVSYDCDFGPRELLTGKLSSCLVGNLDPNCWRERIVDVISTEYIFEDFEFIFRNRTVKDNYKQLQKIYRYKKGE